MRRTPSTSLVVPLLLLSSSLLMICKGCTPAFPAPSTVTSGQGAIGVGLQAIVPSYSFTCNGTIQRVIIRAFGDSGFVFQTWRPRGDGSYGLQGSMSIPQSSQRNGEELSFNSSIPVLSGDTIGYRLEAVSQGKEMRFLLVNTSADVVVYNRMTANVLCELSLCDLSTLNMMVAGLAPFVSVDFVQQDENVAPLSEDPQCTSMEVTPCTESDPPSSSSLPSPTPSTEDPPTSTTEQPSSPEQEQEEEGEGEDNTLLNLNLTTETVIVLAVGIVLFLILIVLVIVLVACVCRKRKPTQYRFKSPTPAYHTVNATIPTATNEAYIATSVPTSPNTAYQVVPPTRESGDIATSTNAAYVATDIATSVNAAYQPTQNSSENTLEYDYATNQTDNYNLEYDYPRQE